MKKLYFTLFLLFCIFKIASAQNTIYSTTYYATSLWQNDQTTVNASWRSNQGCSINGQGANQVIECPSGGYSELLSQDEQFAVCDYANDETKLLIANDFRINFNNLPPGLTRENTEILAIEIQVEKYSSNRDIIVDNAVRIIKHGVVNYNGFFVGESNKAKAGVGWPTSASVITYGGINDPYPLWGTTWTPQDLERADFGVAISAKKLRAQNNLKSYIGMIGLRIVYAKKTQPLPVDFARFTAKPEGNQVVLNWATATEKNNDFFAIEKSENGLEFRTIGTVKGVGNSSQVNEYQFVDDSYTPKTAYYRLKQTDFDGTFAYSAIVSVKPKNNFEPELTIYPNPSDGTSLKLKANILHQATSELKLYSHTGALVYQSVIPATSETVINLDQEIKLPPGVYFVVMTQQNLQLREKLVIQ